MSETAHKGDSCVYCGVAHDDVPPGPCAARAEIARLTAALAERDATLAEQAARLARLTELRWEKRALFVGRLAFGFVMRTTGKLGVVRFGVGMLEYHPTESAAREALEAAAREAVR